MATSYTLQHNPNVYYKIVPAEDCSVNVTAIGGGGGGGYRGTSAASEERIFSTGNLVGVRPNVVRVAYGLTDGSKSNWSHYSQFARDHGVWKVSYETVSSDSGDYTQSFLFNEFDETVLVNFPETGQYNFRIAFDRNAWVYIDGVLVYNQAGVNYTVNNPPIVFTRTVNAGARNVRLLVTRKGAGTAALEITRVLAPVTNSGGRGYAGDRVTANGIKLNKGQAIYAFVGAGGKAATSTTWGDGGSALLGYNGGNGGSAVPGTGGTGGGGGGATCVWRSLDNLVDPTIDPSIGGPISSPGSSEPVPFSLGIPGFYESSMIFTAGIIAGGGGGGAGGGTTSSAAVRNNYHHEPTPIYAKFSNAELVAVSYSAYNQFMNTYGVTLKGKFDSTGSRVFHRKINISSTAIYRVFAAGDDYISIYLDNVPLIGGGKNTLATQAQNYVDVNISAGEHIITVQYENFSQKNACGIVITRQSDGQTIWHTRSNLYSNVVCVENFAPSFGGRGMTNSYNGGAGGGGGGGAQGGRGGIYSGTRTNGGFSGTEGSSYVAPLLLATGITSQNGGGNNGGNAETDGSAGQVTIESTGLLNIFYRQDGVWIPVKEVKQFNGSSWETINEVSVRDNNTWKKVYTFENVDLTLSEVSTSGNAQYSVRSLSNPPVLETLPQATLSILLQFSSNSSGGSDSGGSFVTSSITTTDETGITTTTTTYSDGTQSVSYGVVSGSPADSSSSIDSTVGSGNYDPGPSYGSPGYDSLTPD